MGRLVLVQPLGMNWEPNRKDMSRIANIMPPIGLCSLAAWVERFGHRAEILDFYAYPEEEAGFLDRLRADKPDFVGFSVTTSSFLDAARLARRVKQETGLRTVFGGVHVSALAPRLMREYPEIDLAVAGEGEQALREILDRDGRPPFGVGGIHYRVDGEVVSSGPGAKLPDLDQLPFPDYGKLRGFPDRYKLPLFSYPHAPGTIAVTSRGCVFQCTYCDRSVFGRSYRYHGAEYLIEWFGLLRRRYGIRHLNLYDDNMTVNRERVLGFCEALTRSGLGLSFNCASRPELLDLELLRALKRAGCWTISLGIESGDWDILRRHRSHAVDLGTMRERIGLIRKAGLRVKGLFMIGLPGETAASMARTRDYILSLPLDEFNLTKFTPFPGASCYDGLTREGTLDENWELANCVNALFVPNGLTAAKIDLMFKEIYRRYYQRPRVLARYVPMLWKSPDSWRRFVKDLGSFLQVRRDYR
ncbi:MAG: radical SAM protein [Acidobacteriota bacterium]|nr:radical SAM protein [Acidobacteriota bacterium]